MENRPNNQSQTPDSEKAPAAKKERKEHFYNLKLLAVYFLISLTLSSIIMLIMFLVRAISSPTKAVEQFTEIPTIISIIANFVVSPILTIVAMNKYEKKKHPQPASNSNTTAPAQTGAATNNIVSSFFLNFLFTIFLFSLFAGISGLWASLSCEGNDCGAGWAWGFFFLPFSFIAALAIAPFLTAWFKRGR